MKRNKLIIAMIIILLIVNCMKKENSDNKPNETAMEETENNTGKEQNNNGQINSSEKSTKENYYEEAKKYHEIGKFGHPTVGFIDFPEGESWSSFYDFESGPATLQIGQANVNIYTLDVLQLLNTKGVSDEDIAMQIIQTVYERFYNGENGDKLKISKISLHGYSGAQLRAENLGGKSLISNVFIVGDKAHFVSAEGLPDTIEKMQEHILKTWTPKI